MNDRRVMDSSLDRPVQGMAVSRIAVGAVHEYQRTLVTQVAADSCTETAELP